MTSHPAALNGWPTLPVPEQRQRMRGMFSKLCEFVVKRLTETSPLYMQVWVCVVWNTHDKDLDVVSGPGPEIVQIRDWEDW